MLRKPLSTHLGDFAQSQVSVQVGDVLQTKYNTRGVGTIRDLLFTLMTAYVRFQLDGEVVIEGNVLEMARLYTEDLAEVAGISRKGRNVWIAIIYSEKRQNDGDLSFFSGVLGVVQGESEIDARREAEAYLEQKLSMASDGVVAVPPGPYSIKVIHDLI